MRRSAFSLLEVMIAVAVLSIVLTSVAGSIFGLNSAERAAKDRATAQQLANALAERVMGGTWETLGQDVPSLDNHNCWSWHRRERPTSGDFMPPLTETDVNPRNRIDELRDNAGLITSAALAKAKTGLADLKIYLEYYQMDASDALLASADPVGTWRTMVTSANPITANCYSDTTATRMDLSPVLDAVLVRVLVTWTPVNVSTRNAARYELVFARRK